MGIYQLFQQGEFDLALEAIEKLQAQHAPHAKAYQLHAMILKRQGQHDKAIECLEQSLSLDPNSSEIHNNLANSYRHKRAWSKSIDHYQTALKLKFDYLEARRNLALCYVAQGDEKAARETFNEILKRRPNDVSSLVAMANLDREVQCFDKAEVNYSKAINIQPDYFNAWYNRAINAQMLGNLPLAQSYFKNALKLKADSEEAMISLANIDIELGNFDQASKRLEAFLDIRPEAINAHKALDRLLWEAGDSVKVSQSLKQAIARAPEAQEIYAAYSEQLLLINNAREALAVVDNIFSKFGPNAKALANRASCYAVLGDSAKAIDDLNHSLSLSHDNSVANDLIQLLLINGDFQQAQSVIDKNLDCDNDCQLSWAMQGLVWREQDDERYQWLHQYDRLVKSVILDTPVGYTDLDEYLETLQSVLLSLHRSASAPLDQTLHNGSQTAPKLFAQQVAEVQQFKQLCSQAVSDYISSFTIDEQHPFLRRLRPNFNFSGSWSVRLYDQGFHVNHVHPEGWISSSSYIALPALNSDSDEGCITFGKSSFLQGGKNRVEKIIRPEKGMLVLFPSYTWHGTIPFSTFSDEIRLTAPFDVQPRISL